MSFLVALASAHVLPKEVMHAKLNSLVLRVRKRVALPERLRLLPMTVSSERKTQINRALYFLNIQIAVSRQ